jgi:hypothetical protein
MNGSLKGNCSCYLHGFAKKWSLVLSFESSMQKRKLEGWLSTCQNVVADGLLCIHRIEGHAEHGGTLNEHQLTRLVFP